MTKKIDYYEGSDLDRDTIEAIEASKHVKNPNVECLKKIIDTHSAMVFMWGNDKILVDAMTANALLTVYNALSDDSLKEKFNRMVGGSYNQFIRLVNFAWDHIQ